MQADRSGSPVGTSEERDLDYFERRAEEELALAQNAADPKAVAAHYELACRYLDLVHPETGEE